MPIIISKGGRGAQRIEPTGIGLESDLQEYIHNNPECLPVYEIEEDLRLLILARDVPTSSGPIDALGVDQKGNVYIIETKLYRNADKRHVLSQVLDYGAALWANAEGGTQLLDRLETEVDRHFGESLREKVAGFFGLDADAVTSILDGIRQSVTGGTFRFVVMMDRLDERLKDLIKFVNHNSRFDVYGVELDFYRFEEYEIPIPRLYGAEVRKASTTPSTRTARKWNEQSFFEEAASLLSEEHLLAVRRLYDYCRSQSNSRFDWGAAINGSYIPRFEIDGTVVSPFYVTVSGQFYLKAKWHRDDPAAGPVAARFAHAFQRLFPGKMP